MSSNTCYFNIGVDSQIQITQKWDIIRLNQLKSVKNKLNNKIRKIQKFIRSIIWKKRKNFLIKHIRDIVWNLIRRNRNYNRINFKIRKLLVKYINIWKLNINHKKYKNNMGLCNQIIIRITNRILL